jgi:Kef-type K+ transport system membrane component KefB/predicted amino acid-binding ACT domain protein
LDLIFGLLALLLAARLAAEVAERLKLPAVLLEIGVGVVLGPSLLGFVGKQESLHFVGELGAIFLLLEVGIHMDLGDLRRVGRSATQVAVIGIAAPMALGFVAMRGLGIRADVALFLAAGITATSVGITARVFADMRALATTEAQTVLGAAVADDVIGLLILTVVVRMSATGSVDIGSIAMIAVIGIGFVALATVVGATLAPVLFDRYVAKARTEGALVGVAVAFTLAFAGLASAARLAPIVGAFVAGVALGRIKERDELRERLAPVTHLFVPVFFLLIGAEAHLGAFIHPRTLLIVAVLGTIAVAGKVVAGLGATRGKADRYVIGVGMIPRGEVGVVFATLGLASGVLGAREHAALLFVVLATTVIAPPWLRRRVERRQRVVLENASGAEPEGGWLRVVDGEVDLVTDPPMALASKIGVDAALLCADHRPSARLLDWLSRAQSAPARWDDVLRRRFLTLLRDGNTRSWRFLDVTGLLRSLLPDLEASVRRRKQDHFDLDPSGAMRWREVDALADAVRTDEIARLWTHVDQDVVLVAALARSAFRDTGATEAARRLAETLGLTMDQTDTVALLVDERELLPAAASRTSMGREESVVELASHLGSQRRLDALYILAAAVTTGATEREALRELYELASATLAFPEFSVTGGPDSVETRKRAVLELVHDESAARLVDTAPRRYVLAHPPDVIARHLRMLDAPLARGEVRVHADPDLNAERWTVHVVMHDRPGALAAIARAFARCDVPIVRAWVSTWSNDTIVDVFHATAGRHADWGALRSMIQASSEATEVNGGPQPIDGSLHIDNVSSPWHTIVEVRAEDRTGVLSRVADAFARAGIAIHYATVQTIGTVAVDMFLVTDRNGHKLDANHEQRLRLAFEGKPLRRFSPSKLFARASS